MFTVEQGQRDLGIGLALGCTRAGAVWVVIWPSLASTSVGMAVGLILALAGGRVIHHAVYGVSTSDPATLFTAALSLAIVAEIAVCIPVRRIAKINPMQVLRQQ